MPTPKIMSNRKNSRTNTPKSKEVASLSIFRPSVNDDSFELMCRYVTEGETGKLRTMLWSVPGSVLRRDDHKILRIACELGNLDVMQTIAEESAGLDDYDFNIHVLNRICLQEAAHFGHTDLVVWLLGRGCDPNACEGAPLRHAAMRGHLETVRALHKAGALLDHKDYFALRWAAAEDHLDVVKFLVEKGAPPGVGIHHAKIEGHREIVEYLQEASGEKASSDLQAIEEDVEPKEDESATVEEHSEEPVVVGEPSIEEE
eukprot:18968_1